VVSASEKAWFLNREKEAFLQSFRGLENGGGEFAAADQD
jgi:hypothetical protein